MLRFFRQHPNNAIGCIAFAPFISLLRCRMNHPHRSPIWIKVVDVGVVNRFIQHPWRPTKTLVPNRVQNVYHRSHGFVCSTVQPQCGSRFGRMMSIDGGLRHPIRVSWFHQPQYLAYRSRRTQLANKRVASNRV